MFRSLFFFLSSAFVVIGANANDCTVQGDPDTDTIAFEGFKHKLREDAGVFTLQINSEKLQYRSVALTILNQTEGYDWGNSSVDARNANYSYCRAFGQTDTDKNMTFTISNFLGYDGNTACVLPQYGIEYKLYMQFGNTPNGSGTVCGDTLGPRFYASEPFTFDYDPTKNATFDTAVTLKASDVQFSGPDGTDELQVGIGTLESDLEITPSYFKSIDGNESFDETNDIPEVPEYDANMYWRYEFNQTSDECKYLKSQDRRITITALTSTDFRESGGEIAFTDQGKPSTDGTLEQCSAGILFSQGVECLTLDCAEGNSLTYTVTFVAESISGRRLGETFTRTFEGRPERRMLTTEDTIDGGEWRNQYQVVIVTDRPVKQYDDGTITVGHYDHHNSWWVWAIVLTVVFFMILACGYANGVFARSRNDYKPLNNTGTGTGNGNAELLDNRLTMSVFGRARSNNKEA